LDDAVTLLPEEAVSALLLNECVDCQDKGENWICLKCGSVFCSRFIKGHCSDHYTHNVGHPICVSISDFSVWCYACDNYVTSPSLYPILNQMHITKHGVELDKESLGDLDMFVNVYEEGGTPPPDGLFDILKMFQKTFKINNVPLSQTKILPSPTMEGVAEAIRSGTCKNIIVLSGAGISVAAGIPDFRTPGTGLYDNLEKYNLPYPEAIFEIEYFKTNPNPFFVLAKELYPGNFRPTPCHYFVRLLHEKGVLIRNYTQNIDTLERVAGVPEEKLIEAHGSFGMAHCIKCKMEYSSDNIKEIILRGEIPKCTSCNSVVKPDIVFFGENLPMKIFSIYEWRFPKM